MIGAPQISAIERGLAAVGYEADWLHRDVPVESGQVPLVAYSGSPYDARTACITALQGNCNNVDAVAAHRAAAAPVTIVAGTNEYEVWRQETGVTPHLLDRVAPENLGNYFTHNRAALAPQAIYRRKVWGRLEPTQPNQLNFVDVGLLPVLEEEMGKRLTTLTVGAVVTARDALGWIEPTFDQGQWLVKSVFWLLAAKILQDKKVPGFIQLDLDDLDTVFGRLARHYHSTQPSPVTARDDKRRAALLEAVAGIKRFAHLGLLSTEALAYLYESALIDKETRQALGTHSTPSWMVDYVVGTLRPWIDEMPVADRRVFEPACGHGGFLISGLRLLSEMRPKGYGEDRRSYLRKRLRGIEFDPFAVEIARLSLTLTDVPNPNGWALSTGDMFAGDVLAKEAAAATIVLCNPPFERFAASDRKPGWQLNKASETLRRILANLPEGGVFGVVLPPGFLKSKQDAALRKSLLSGCEVKEITLFADKVFRRGAPEPVVLLGRKSKVSATATVVYQRVREGQIQQFKTSYAPSSHELVVQSSFRLKNKGSLFFAELSALWEGLAHLPRLGDMAEIGQGLSHRGADDETVPRNAIRESAERANGLTSGFGGWTETQMTHELPTERWLNLDEKMISRRRSGTKRGEGQLLLNYPRVSREGWCLKALIDREGHPVTSDFSVVRPRRASLLVFWAFLNSPLANAFAHTHSDKWHVLVGTLRKMPVPDASSQDLTTLERAVSTYLEAAELFSKAPKQASPSAQGDLFERPVAKAAPGARPPTAEEVRILHWRVDAEVLRLYELPAELERNLLVFFAGVARRGVPFEQTEYFPARVEYLHRLRELLAVTSDWEGCSARKEALIEKKLRRQTSPAELAELQELKRLSSARRELFAPLPVQALEQVKTDLMRRGILPKESTS